MIEHGLKRWIPNPEIFQKLSYDWKKILFVGNSALSGIPPGDKLENGDNYPDGALIRAAKRKEIYVVDQGKRRWIPNPDIFYSNNFSPRNIVIVSEEKLKSIERGTDVKNGEFILLPSTFISEKPLAEINFTKVVFRYSGTNPTGPVSELNWETFLEGYDDRWQRTSEYSRVFDLPAINKSYTFYVRSRNKDGKVASRPASFSFKVIGFSFFNKKLKTDGIKSGGSFNLDEYIKIANISNEKINITGMIVKNKADEIAIVPKGTKILYVGERDDETDIILEPGKSAFIFTGSAPVGKSFLLNKCTGYLNIYNFLVRPPQECPRPAEQEIASFSRDCRDYIKGLGTCEIPNTAAPKIAFEKECTDFLAGNLNYVGCLKRYRSDPDFLKNDWYIYLNRTNEFWDDRHDEAKLLDKENNLIDSYSY